MSPFGGIAEPDSELDAELVTRVRAGDAGAFETLVRRHLRLAFLVAYARLGNREDAEDVCQDAFVRCWERIAECRDPSRVGAWIAAIVRNAALNRRDARRVRAADPIERGIQVPSRTGADAATYRHELRDRLVAAMVRLTPAQREVVLLHDLEGWKHAEIASRLDLSEEMSRRHLSDARKRLRALLGDYAALGCDHD